MPPRKQTVRRPKRRPYSCTSTSAATFDAPKRLCRRRVDRHRLVDPVVPGMIGLELPAAITLDKRERVRPVAVHLVRGREDEHRLRCVEACRLEQVQRPDCVDVEIGERLTGRPVVGGLCCGVHDERDLVAVAAEETAGRRRGHGYRWRGARTRCRAVARAAACSPGSMPPARRRRRACRCRHPRSSIPAPPKCNADSNPISPHEPVTTATPIRKRL